MKKHYAVLFYGIIPPIDSVMPWEESETSWQECIATRHKINPPSAKLVGNEDIYDDYWKEVNTLIKKLGINVLEFGSEKNTKYVFAIRDTIYYASQEFEEIIDTKIFSEKQNEWNKLLKNFCKILDIKEKEVNPQWYLVSYAEVS